MEGSEYYLEDIKNGKKRLILELEEVILMESMRFYNNRGIRWLSAPVTTGTISSPM